jgi:cysteine desulfurase
LAETVEKFINPPVFPKELLISLTHRLIAAAGAIEGVKFRGSLRSRLANTAAFTVSGCDSIGILAGLDLEGICASSGSACSAGSLEPSHVMLAMGVENRLANALVRFSLGRDTTLKEIESTEGAFKKVCNRARSC